MNFFDNVKDGVSAAVNSLSDAAQNLVEKNRTNAKLNRLRAIMKTEAETISKAYESLGKIYYEKMSAQEMEENELLCQIIESGEERLERAHIKYLQILDEKKEEAVSSAVKEKANLQDITLACSNEEEYSSSPFVPSDKDHNKKESSDISVESSEEKPFENSDGALEESAKEAAEDEAF